MKREKCFSPVFKTQTERKLLVEEILSLDRQNKTNFYSNNSLAPPPLEWSAAAYQSIRARWNCCLVSQIRVIVSPVLNGMLGRKGF